MELRTILAFVSSFFGIATTAVNVVVLIAILGPRRAYYQSHFFYVIFMVGVLIDIVALVNCHMLALLPSKGLFLDMFLSSTKLGRIFLFFAWSTRTSQGFTHFFIALNRATAIIWSQNSVRILCFTIQFGFGVAVGIIASVLDVYWINTTGDSWYIQFYNTPITQRFFRYVFGLITFFSMLTIAAYVVLLCNFQAVSRKKVRNSASGEREDSRNEQSLVYLAISIIYYIMYCYGFVMNANFELNLETVYVSYFLVTDLYSCVPPYLLLYFSTPIQQDVRRLLQPLQSQLRKRIEYRVTPMASKTEFIRNNQ